MNKNKNNMNKNKNNMNDNNNINANNKKPPFYNYLLKIIDYTTLDKIVVFYEKILIFIIRIITASTNFIKSAITLLPDVTDLKLLLRILVSTAFYSKIIITLAVVLPCPKTVLVVANSIVDTAIAIYNSTIGIISGAWLSISRAVLEFNEEKGVREVLQTELKNVQEQHIRELENVQELNIKEKNRDYEKISKLEGDVYIKDEINRKLSLHNSELTEVVKSYKTATSLEKGITYVTMIGNISLICVQCVNAYNIIFNPSSAGTQRQNIEEIKKLTTSVNNMLTLLGRQNVGNIAQQRAAAAQQRAAATTTQQGSDDSDNSTPTTLTTTNVSTGPAQTSLNLDDHFTN